VKRSTPLRRRTPLLRAGSPRSRQRRIDRHAAAYGTHAAVVRAMDCLVRGCRVRPVQAAHVKSRGAGGTWRDLIPLCWRHHGEQHAVGVRTFAARHGLDLAAAAAALVGEGG
jgi:hypothetical protein